MMQVSPKVMSPNPQVNIPSQQTQNMEGQQNLSSVETAVSLFTNDALVPQEAEF